MELSKETEQEIRLIYQTYWDAYLNGDFETFASFLDDDIVIYGTAVGEIFYTKDEALNFYIATAEEMTGKADFRNRHISIKAVGDTIVIYDQSQLYILIDGAWTYYGSARITGIMELKSSGWKLVHQHGSFPDSRTEEGQQVASAKIKEENLQLREAVQRRTIELENKTLELSIEASLERVRTVAMSMNKPDDMLEVCRMIADQLEMLGIKEIRNVQTAIINENGNGTYMNYQYFKQYEKGTIEEVAIAKHPAVQDMIQRMQQSPDAFFSTTFVGPELDVWRQYRKDDNQFPDPILEDASSLHFYFYSIGQGGLGLSVYTPLSDDKNAYFHRFRNVFALAYQRFRDIEQAEEQAREARIEAALERVRSRTMAMQKSEELSETAQVLFNQFIELGEKPIQITIGIIHEEEKLIEFNVTDWAGGGSKVSQSFMVSINEPTLVNKLYEAWRNKEKSLVIDLSGQELEDWLTYRKAISGIEVKSGDTHGRRVITSAFFSKGHVSFSSPEPRPAESVKLLERFASVFDLTYTRFLDLQQAEAQTREAQIELALERVRARTMAMQKSDELQDVIQVVYDQFIQLNVRIEHSGFIMDYKTRDDMYIWLADNFKSPFQITIPYFDSPHWNSFLRAKKRGDDFFSNQLNFEEKNKFYTDLFNLIPGLPEESQQAIFAKPGLAISTVLLENVGLYIENFSDIPYSDEENATLLRFGNVFQQAYTRFRDLQKAEAQAREAQIELALERVRARSMAMQHSEELQDTSLILFRQLKELGEPAEQCTIGIVKESEGWVEISATLHGNMMQQTFRHSINEPFVMSKIFRGWKDQQRTLIIELNEEELQKYNQYRNELVGTETFPVKVLPGDRRIIHAVYFSKGMLALSTNEPRPAESLQLLERFAKVFEQTYTRFLDLQKAEAQAKEAQIEAALEKVRSRTMAMQNSSELGAVAAELFAQMNQLVTNLWTCGFVLCEKDRDEDEWWLSMDGDFTRGFFLPNVGDYAHATLYEGWLKREALRAVQLDGDSLQQHYDWLMEIPVSRAIFDEMDAAGLARPDWQKLHAAYFSKGYLVLITREPCGEEEIFKRFAQVFEQTYTRFLDLQKAESQTQKVRIEVALERVRARALAMQEPEELVDVAQVMRYEMGLLGVEELETSSIYIHDEASDIADCWYAIKDIRAPDKKLVADHITLELHKTWVGREMLEFFTSTQQKTSIVMQGGNRIEWIKYCSSISNVLGDFYGDVIPDRTYHLYKFSNGAIGAAAEGDISEESWELLRRATSVFSLAYSRFKDLTQARIDLQKLKTEKQRAEDALTHLKDAQAQLIQAEKMASLGELTAGIAHEIQNPLNFVNNFSEINKELLLEMKEELDNGNMGEVNSLASDVISNEEKIIFHGKRADAIVKGMLQHSRSSSGVKELTDINSLADEYLRLAYHGLRAKDKTFNASMKTDFDLSIGSINIIPQEIGRVILNLITNAFYVVNEKKKHHPNEFEPIVSVTTKKADQHIVLIVKDNGIGIPKEVMDKIFQPFFTTKPTGQGTGLGLSLSYDIVKAHGGELKVETKEGEGSAFIIHLPIN